MFNEKNIIKKNPLKINLRFASVYPNIYRVAMSSLGYQIIYGLVNEREDTWCERVIYPGNRSLESNSPLNDFDIISFTLHYEQDYFNLIEILKKSNIPLKKEDRDDTYPMIICGGPSVSSNPLPISDFIDLFIIGEAEAILNKFLNRYQELNNPKKEINSFLDIDGIYIYDNPVKRTIIKDMKDAYQVTNPIITETDNQDFMPVFGNAITLNVSRGCIRGCRFCMTGYTCRPLRETSLKILLKTVDEVREKTGLKKVLLTGAAVSDYSKIDELTSKLLNKGFQISTSSLRVESTSYETLNNLKISGLKTITIAPESIYSLRKTLNKNISDLKIDELIKTALDMNFNIKFYFLLGILNESMADIKELSKYIKYINSIKYDRNNLKQAKIKFSFNPLIPKPHTPFQWQKYDFKDIKNKIRFLRKDLRRLSVKFDSPKMGLIQYVLSCKGREISNLIAETTDERRLKDFKINLNKWNEHSTPFSLNDKLPWKNIDNGISEDFLKKEHEKML